MSNNYGLVRCPNMNHGRSNAPVQFCPLCGETVNRLARRSCDSARHMVLRKQGDTFCIHCAKNLKN